MIALVLLAPLAGCIGDQGDDQGASAPAPEESFRVFLAATGSSVAPAEGTLEGVAVKNNATQATQFLTLQAETFDLAELAAGGQAILAATTTDLEATVSETTVVFANLTVGNQTFTDARLPVPLTYPAAAGTEATVTIDLAATQETGQLTIDNLLVEAGGQQVAVVTASELETGPREEIVPLAQPTIVAKAAESDDTAPSFQLNEPIDFTIRIDQREGAEVRQVFWSFSDGSTTSGTEVTHTFREPGLQNVTLIVEGTRGQQARANASLDIYWTTSGEGNIGVGTGGTGLLEGRDVKTHKVAIPGERFTNVSIRHEASTSGGQDGTPSNLHVELLNPDGEVVVANTTDSRIKYLNTTVSAEDALPGGNWTLRVKGDSGAAVGYKYEGEVHYLALACLSDQPLVGITGTPSVCQ